MIEKNIRSFVDKDTVDCLQTPIVCNQSTVCWKADSVIVRTKQIDKRIISWGDPINFMKSNVCFFCFDGNSDFSLVTLHDFQIKKYLIIKCLKEE